MMGVFRFIDEYDQKWFDSIFEKSVLINLGNEYGSLIVQEPYFVNFMRDDDTDDENEKDENNSEPIRSFNIISDSATKIYEEVGNNKEIIFAKKKN